MTRPDPRTTSLAVAALALLVIAVVLVVPFFTTERRVAATIPQPAPLFAANLVEVPAGAEACMRPVTYAPKGETAELKVATFGRPPVPLSVTLSAPGYAVRVVQRPTYVDNATLSLRVASPRRPVRGSACVRNDGDRRIALYGAEDRTRRAAVTTVAGKRVGPNFQLAFYERAPRSLAARFGEIADRATAFRPVGPWAVWALAALVLLAVPAALLAAIAAATREDSDGGA